LKKNILIVLGTRPEAIKLIPLYFELIKYNSDYFNTKLCVTGQHEEMVNQIIDIFDVKPDYYLKVMRNNQTLTSLVTKIIDSVTPIILQNSTDIVIVQGDTTTAFATALAAYYCQVEVSHIEAGLRTYDLNSPFPEEGNRRLISSITKLHFAPTQFAMSNLLKESIMQEQIFVTGNTGIDSLLLMKDKIYSNQNIKNNILSQLKNLGYEVSNREFLLMTGHRRESFGNGFKLICDILLELANNYKDIDIVYPVHLNPNVRDIVFSKLKGVNNIYLLPPLKYDLFIMLMDRCKLILTDSGGVQEEAPTFRKPAYVFRETTERQEGVESGFIKLVGNSNKESIYASISLGLLSNFSDFNLQNNNPFGNGDSSKKITKILKNVYFNE